MAGTITMAVYLAAAGLQDIREKAIGRLMLILGIIPPLVSLLADNEPGLLYRAGGLAVGAFLIFVSRISREQLGMADAVLICIIGMTVGIYACLAVMGLSFLLASLFSLVMIALGKAGRKTRIAFVPFLFAGFAAVAVPGIAGLI